MPLFQKIPSNKPSANELVSESTKQPQLVCTWSAPAPQSGSSPSLRRRCHTLTATANAARELFFFGGHGDVGANSDVYGTNSDVYVFSTRDFSTTLLRTSGEVPTPRYAHCAALIGTTLLICGGLNDRRNLNDDSLYLLNLETREWSHVVVNGPGPGGRCDHTANVVGSKLFIFGGWDGQKTFDDMWTLDLNGLIVSQPVWESYEPTPGNEKPLPRGGHVSVTTGDHIIIFGGYNQQNDCCNDTWSFDISTRKWTELQCTGSIPSPRIHHAAVLVDGVMYVFGGYTDKNYHLDELIALQLSTQRWFDFRNAGQSPHGKRMHVMASDGTHVFVHGGGSSPRGALGELHVFDTKDIKYPEPERDAVNPNEKTTQLPRARNSSTGPSTQVQPQRPTPSSSNAHSASCHGMQKASPTVSGHPTSSQITREHSLGPNSQPLEHAVVRDPEDGVIGGSTEYHAKFSEPHSSSEGVARLELERQPSVSVSVQTERDEELVDMQAQLDELLLSRDQQIGQYERKLEAVCLRLADAEKGLTSLDKLVVSHDQQVTDMSAKLEAKEFELEAVRLRLTDAEKVLTSLDELVVSHDQQVGQHEKELTDMRAKLEAKESELEAVRLRLTDAEKNITDSRNRDEDKVTRELMERMQAIEDEVARGSKRWNEKSIEEMVCRNEG